MKHIKFRLLIEGKFVYWGFIEKDGKMTFIPPPKPSKKQIDSFNGIMLLSRQFTHAYDKNGSAIYEGAILKEHPNGIIGLVIKDECGNFSVEWDGDFPDWSWSEMFYDKQDRIEISGDIDKTPELWKKNK